VQKIEIAESVDTMKRLSNVFSVEVVISHTDTQGEITRVIEVEFEEGEKVPKGS